MSSQEGNLTGIRKRQQEEFIDQEMLSPDKKGQAAHKRLQSTDKKKKRKQSESASSEVKDESMVDEEVNEDAQGDSQSDDDDDDEDEDDEYDDEDEESIKDFIVEDDEALEEFMDEEEEKPSGREEKKKKKRVKERKLDEEDLELIEENIGVKLQKRKRLQKHSEKERDQIDQRYEKPEEAVDEQQDYEQQVEEEEPEQIDTSARRPQQLLHSLPSSKRVQYEQNQEYYADDKARAANRIFEDPARLAETIKQRKLQMEREKQAEKADLEEIFDGDEIDDQFATKQDKLIIERDIPERLQIKIGERLACNFQGDLADDINEETEFIYNRLVDITRRDDLNTHDLKVKKNIRNIIQYLRRDYLDVPMIAKYRKYDYQRELTEKDVWQIFNLDLEYGKFQHQKQQMRKFISKIAQIESSLEYHASDIDKAMNLKQLQNSSALISFYKQYYYDELQALSPDQKKRMPFKQDQIAIYKKNRLDQFAKEIFMDPVHFIENLLNNDLIYKPPRIQNVVEGLIPNYLNEVYTEPVQVLQAAIKFASIWLSVQPYLRTQMKDHLYNTGHISTFPTAQGVKALDVFHPSYRVKRIFKEPISQFQNDDRFLDIVHNEKRELITVVIGIEDDQIQKFFLNLQEKYIPQDYHDTLKEIYKEVIRTMLLDILIPELTKEIKDELTESTENFVIQKCQQNYQHTLMTGPFSCESLTKKTPMEDRLTSRGRRNEEEIIGDRPRCTVMGAILQQIDQNTSIVTVAIVDKYGELLDCKDLQHLLPPRKFHAKNNQSGTEEEEQRLKKAKLSHIEEVKEHEKCCDEIKRLIEKHQVDLIVVGANRLEARFIKKVLSDISEKLKNYGDRNDYDDDDNKRGSKKRQRDGSEETKKEAFVIWGSLEVPKLFANCHQSHKLLRNYHPIVKQAVSLARFEQDPLIEILNLWSFVPSENQVLQLNLHPMQKLINQAKLSDALEEINVQCVNAIGVDLNLVIDHDHMNIVLSFLSGIGPRKAKKFIQTLKQLGKKIATRGEIFMMSMLDKICHLSAIAFLKIRIPPEEAEQKQQFDILDQTRIHPESYMVAHKVGRDVKYEGKDVDQYLCYQAVQEIIKNPSQLKDLDLKFYKEELESSQQTNMIVLLDLVIEELKNPFKDPREYRYPEKLQISNAQLFYMLIDESERTFKRGIIVSATVTRVFDNMVLCKLDNGLDAIIQKQNLDKSDEKTKLDTIIEVGNVIPGRIHEIRNQEEARFQVILNCRRKDLENHKNYIGELIEAHQDDLINSAFQVDNKVQLIGRYQNRRINHPKFKNASSQKVIQELEKSDVGDFIFRPSSRGSDHLTLTWKFYSNNIVHIDIVELDKPIGANIGSKLQIGEEIFDNLQEIIERYIMPCNRHLRDATNHPKFKHCEAVEELDKILKDEKATNPNNIPYKFTILPQYPQHVVLGYIPRQSLVKEFLKIKPRGFQFHENVYSPLQSLINWFKENFRQRDYQKFVKRQRSPKARVNQDANQNQRPSGQSAELPQQDWTNVDKNWRPQSSANSVHSLNDDNNEHGGNNRGGYGGGYSDNNQNQKMSDVGEQRGRGGAGRGCFNCGEQGHMSRECPNQRKPLGRGRGRDDNGRGSHKKYGDEADNSNKWGDNNNNNDDGNGWGNTNQGGNSPGASNGWGNQQPLIQKSPGTGWGNDDNGSNAAETSGGWGKKTPQRVDNFSGGGWGDSNVNDNWGNSGENNYDRKSSPARSQRSQDDNGRGRGRGRSSRGGGDAGFQNRGGPRACFKCQQEGHMARECPNQDQRQERGRGNGGGGGRNCFKCQQEGHMARDCPNQDSMPQRGGDRGERGRGRGRGSGGGGGRSCHRCNQEGHFARECPNEQQANGERPYKRQRRDDGGSVRRDDGGNDWNNNNDNGGGWAVDNTDKWRDSNNNEGSGWGASRQEEADAWRDNNNSQRNNQNEGGWGQPEQSGW